jgi:hypothetical protein
MHTQPALPLVRHIDLRRYFVGRPVFTNYFLVLSKDFTVGKSPVDICDRGDRSQAPGLISLSSVSDLQQPAPEYLTFK